MKTLLDMLDEALEKAPDVKFDDKFVKDKKKDKMLILPEFAERERLEKLPRDVSFLPACAALQPVPVVTPSTTATATTRNTPRQS